MPVRGMILAAAAGAALATPAAAETVPDALGAHHWDLKLWNGMPALDGVGRSVTLSGDARSGVVAEGAAGCNTYRAHVVIDGTSIRFSDIASVTRMACEGARRTMEDRFKAALAAVERYTVGADTLILEGKGVKLEFTAKPLR